MSQKLLYRKPKPGEYGPFYKGYIEEAEEKYLPELLADQREEFLNLLSGLSEEDALYRYSPGKWSVKQVVGHLADTELIFCYRALSIARANSPDLPGYDHDTYVENADFDRKALQALLGDYQAVRSVSIRLFSSFSDETLAKKGIVNENPGSVRAIGFIIAGHERHHMTILRDRYLEKV